MHFFHFVNTGTIYGRKCVKRGRVTETITSLQNSYVE